MDELFRILIILFFLKTLIIGSDFNFFLLIKYRGVYWKWYNEREKFIPKNINKKPEGER